MRGWRQVREWPWLGDVTLVAVLSAPALASGVDGRLGDVHPALGVLAIAAVLPLVGRRRRPVRTLAAVLVIGGALPVTGAFVLPALVALYTVATLRPWPTAVAGGLAFIAASLLHDALWGEPVGFTQDVLPLVLETCAVVALGLYVAARRAYVAALRERAERLQRERELLAERAVAEERLRIAQELHDVVGHNVALMVVQAQALGATAGSPQVAVATDAIADLGRETMAEMHRTLRLVRGTDEPAERGPQPGLADLDGLVAHARAAGVPVRLTVRGTPRSLPAGVDLSAYRIVQEALTNVVKHARRAATDVVVSYEPAAVELVIADEGGGDGGAAASAGGHGLIGMRERVALYGGTLKAGARDGRGFEVRASLPSAAGDQP